MYAYLRSDLIAFLFKQLSSSLVQSVTDPAFATRTSLKSLKIKRMYAYLPSALIAFRFKHLFKITELKRMDR